MEQQTHQQAAAVNKEFNNECLEAHNKSRQLHGCEPLTLNLQLASSAQAWANHLADMGQLQHSTPNPKGSYGENIAMKMLSGSREYKGSQCTAQWYSEIEMYDFNGGENQMNCGHFSQVVWKSTKEAGFGKAIAPDGKMFAVGQYSPPGNFMNKWKANVPPPLSGKIQAPTKEDIMGPQQQSQQQLPQSIKQPQQISVGGGGGGGSGGNLKPTMLPQPGAPRPTSATSVADPNDPPPADPRDKPVGKGTKTRIVNGEKSVTVTVTFARPDGSRYQVTKETTASGQSKITFEGQQPQQQAPPMDLSAMKRSLLQDLEQQEAVVQPARQRRNFAAPPTAASEEDVEQQEDTPDGDRVTEQEEEQGVEEQSEEELSFAEEVVRQHNQLRKRHGGPELERSESLDRLASSWAASLSKSRDLRHCRPVKYGNGQVGQNIAKRPAVDGGGSGDCKLAAQQLLQQWYGEKHKFAFGEPDPDDIGGGHFSQLVWRASEKLGIGLAVDKESGDQYSVCFYYPCGNLVGQFAENVLPGDY